MNQVTFTLQYACKNIYRVPKNIQFKKWLDATIPSVLKAFEITIRIVDETESCHLNRIYRKQNTSTNVLSFPFITYSGVIVPLLGDLVICQPVVEREANEMKKQLDAYWAHIVIHGCLHLLGYNHTTDNESKNMKYMESNIILSLGYEDPFLLSEE